MQDIATTQDGGVSNLAVGTFVGDDTICRVVTGFKPRYVKLINLTDRIVDEKTYDMPVTDGLHTVAAGTMTKTTSSDLTFGGGQDGFRGFDIAAATNINGKTFHYIAFG